MKVGQFEEIILLIFLKDNNLWGNKHIIDTYKYNNEIN